MGGRRDGALLHPTILANVDPAHARRVRGDLRAGGLAHPVRRRSTRRSTLANATPFGLAAGIFTKDITRAMAAARRLHVGLVHVNEPSSSRVDLMPFGGVKQSGLGREGPKYAMQEMTEERLITSRASGRSSQEHRVDDRSDVHGADCLKQEGVTKVFGQCGHTNYALIDACHKLGIEYVSFRHEQQAAHAADAYFRVSHRLAVRQRAPVAGHDQRDHRRGHRRRRLDADGGHLRQHAVVSPRPRAAPGHPLPRRRLAGRHLPPVLQARLAHRRREVPAPT